MTAQGWRPLVAAATRRLGEAGVASPRADAELLAAHVLGRTRGQLLLAPVPSPEQAAAYDVLVARRAAREPLQHLTGRAAFRHVELAVGPGVFVPRPETEVLAGAAVEEALAVQAREGRPARVVDLCTGSGAIALAVADEVPGVRVHAVELDAAAHRWARRNLDGTGVELRLGDMADAFADLDGTVDVVVSNPPYIPLGAVVRDPEVAAHDPAVALWSGADGLDAMRVVEQVAARLLREDGLVAAEHADVQGESAPAVFAATGRWTQLRDGPDLAGRPRVVSARRAMVR